MASVVKEKVQVVELTKYGFKDGTGAYVGWSKQLPEAAKTPVVPGRSFDMELYIADSGKRYVNAIIAQATEIPLPVAPRGPGRPPKVGASIQHNFECTPAGAAMTRTDWDNKDTRISRQGVIQAAVKALAGQVPLEALFTEAELLAEDMLKFVNEIK